MLDTRIKCDLKTIVKCQFCVKMIKTLGNPSKSIKKHNQADARKFRI